MTLTEEQHQFRDVLRKFSEERIGPRAAKNPIKLRTDMKGKRFAACNARPAWPCCETSPAGRPGGSENFLVNFRICDGSGALQEVEIAALVRLTHVL